MPAIRPYEESDAARWDAYVATAPGSHFGQTVAWKHVTERAYDVTARYWLAESDGRVCGVLPLFERRGHSLFSAPGGLLADDESVAALLLEPARARLAPGDLDWIELRDQRREWPGLETSREHVTLELVLEPSAEQQWSTFDAKLRNQVRKAEKSKFEPRWGHAHLAAFHRVLLENLRDLGTPVRGPGYFRLALEQLGAAADLLVIDHEGNPAGAMFFVTHSGTAADPWASSLRRYFSLCPNHALYWTAIRRAIDAGLTRFDFGRSQWASGTFRFKQQWGATPVQLYYQYVLGRSTSPPTLADQKSRFASAVRFWRMLPLPVAGVLGEQVKRWFPEVL